MDSTDVTKNLDLGDGASRRRRILRRVAWLSGLAIACLIAVIMAALVGVRLYYNDDRLHAMAVAFLDEKLEADFELGPLDTSIFTGIELGGLRIGPLPGFDHDTISFERLAVHWSLVDLVFLDLIIDEVALEGVKLTVEENDHGRNLDALKIAFTDNAQPAPEKEKPEEPKPEEEPKEPEPIEQPFLPIRVEVRRLALGVDSLKVLRPDLELDIDRIKAEGSFVGDGSSFDLDVWVGLGERSPEGEPSRLRVRGETLPGDLDIEQRFGVRITSSGLGDIAIDLDWDAVIRMSGDMELPPVHLAAKVGVAVNLLTQELELKPCSMSFGDQTRLDLAARIQSILTQPHLLVDTVAMRSNLGELAPLVAAFVDGAELDGKLTVDAEPFELSLAPGRMQRTAASVVIRIENLRLVFGANSADGIDATLTLGSDGEIATVRLAGTMEKAAGGGQTARGVGIDVEVRTPLAPWIGGEPVGDVESTVRLTLDRAGSSKGWTRGFVATLDSRVPIVLIKTKTSDTPIESTLELRMTTAGSPQATVRNLDMKLVSSVWDLQGENLDATLATSLGRIIVAQPGGPMRIDGTTLAAQITRRGQRFSIGEFDLATAGTLRLRMQGTVDETRGPAPIFDRFEIRLGPVDLEQAIALAPESTIRKMSADIGGTATAVFRIDGRVPYEELAKLAQPPKIDNTDNTADTADTDTPPDPAVLMQLYAEYLDAWAAQFERGLPFSMSLTFDLNDFVYADAANEVSGVDVKYVFEFLEHGPKTSLDVTVAEVKRPVRARDIHANATFAFGGMDHAGLEATIEGVVGVVERADLPRPLEGAGFDIALGYRIGGDLALDRFVIEAPDRGVRLEASGVISKPLRFAMARAWEKPGLPGLDATLRWSASMEAGDLEPMTIGGPKIGGTIALSGKLRAADGIISLDGLFHTSNFYADDGKTLVDDLSGDLPFDVQLTFDPLPEATVLRRNVAIGSGVIALLTSETDIRQRPARPVYYERLRPYRQRKGLSARRLKSGAHEISDFELEGRLTQGMLLADWIAM
ncbi:MAG: hypothetical protein V3T05_13705, partial [Myxococcota bacterium]